MYVWWLRRVRVINIIYIKPSNSVLTLSVWVPASVVLWLLLIMIGIWCGFNCLDKPPCFKLYWSCDGAKWWEQIVLDLCCSFTKFSQSKSSKFPLMYRYNDALVGGIEWKDIDWFRVDVIDTVELQVFIKHFVVGTEVAIFFAHMWVKFRVISIILQVCHRIVYLYCASTLSLIMMRSLTQPIVITY